MLTRLSMIRIARARIALIVYQDGEKRYILAPNGIKVGDAIMSGAGADIRPGNAMPIRNIPLGTMVHNVELQPGRGGQIVRSAGNAAKFWQKMAHWHRSVCPAVKFAIFRWIVWRRSVKFQMVTIRISVWAKQAASRWKGIRPSVRGVAMDPSGHPHGGGEGRSPIGMKAPKTPWGKKALGVKTRRNKRTNKFIVRRANAASAKIGR